jgi:threonine/homoserine/homoserine lactone efflux protein
VNFASLFSGLLLGYSLAVPPGPMNALIAAWSRRGQRFFAPFYAAGVLFFLYPAYKIGTAKPPQEGSADAGHPLRGHLLGLSLGLVNPYQVDLWRR